MSARTVTVLNGSRHSKTLKALAKLKRKAKGKDKRAISRLEKGLTKSNPATRSRKPSGVSVQKHHHRAARRKTHTVHRKATARRKVRRNPTRSAAVIPFGGAPRRRRKAGLFGKVRRAAKAMHWTDVVKLGIGITIGNLASSAVDKQVEKFLPSANAYVRAAAGGVIVGAIGFFVRKMNKDVGNGIMAGAVAETLRAFGRQLAPGVFSGTEDLSSGESYQDDGYYQPELGGDIGIWDAQSGTYFQGLQQAPTLSTMDGVIWDPRQTTQPNVQQFF